MMDFDTEIFIEDIHSFWAKNPIPVIHCGAHLAEEAADYYKHSFKPVVWIEAAPNLIPTLLRIIEQYPGDSVIEAALWSESKVKKTLRIANNSYSSSLREFGTLRSTYPEIEYVSEVIVDTTTLDEIDIPNFRKYLLVLDLQGIELDVLLGAKEVLKRCEYVYLEVSKQELYSGQAVWGRVDDFLVAMGFRLVDWQYSENYGWGNALYSSKTEHFVKFKQWLRRRRHLQRSLNLSSPKV